MASTQDWMLGASALRLSADRYGPFGAPRVVLVHGGGQTRSSWKGTASAIARSGYQVWSIDARGHGESDWSPAGDYSMDAMRDDLRACITQIGGSAIVIGASMGGIMGLLVAGECDPSLCDGLVLVDVTPRVNPVGRERIIGFMRSHQDGFQHLDEAAAAVAAFSVGRSRPATVDGLRRNLRARDGRLFWHWDPRFLETWDFGPDAAERVETAARAVQAPILLVHAGRSEVVREEDVAQFLRLAPHARYARVKDSGHMIAGDQNDPFKIAILDFLESIQAPATRRVPEMKEL